MRGRLPHAVVRIRRKPPLELPHQLLRGHLQRLVPRARELHDLALALPRREHEPDRPRRERRRERGER